MQCPKCNSAHIRKNGSRKGKQRYICANCQRQFLGLYEPYCGYCDDIKQECLELYLNGMGFRAIERVKHVHHTTIIYWVKQLGDHLPDAPVASNILEVTELDELQTFVGSKKQNLALDCGRALRTRY